MNQQSRFPSELLGDLIDQLDEAIHLCQVTDPNALHQALEALIRSREVAQALADHTPVEPRKRREYRGNIDWTFQDETGGREILARVYYDWEDYSPGDHDTPSYGGFAQVADIEIREIRYYSGEGKPISREEYDRNLVWELAEQCWAALEDACTEAGYRSDAGQPDPLYFPATTAPSRSVRSEGLRMAASARRRSRDKRSREVG